MVCIYIAIKDNFVYTFEFLIIGPVKSLHLESMILFIPVDFVHWHLSHPFTTTITFLWQYICFAYCSLFTLFIIHTYTLYL